MLVNALWGDCEPADEAPGALALVLLPGIPGSIIGGAKGDATELSDFSLGDV